MTENYSNLKFNKEMVHFFSFLFIFLFANRGWFFDIDVLIGHNWDFQFPYDLYTGRLNIASNYLWHDAFGNTNLLITHYILNNIYVYMSKLFSASILIKIIYSLTFFTAFYSMRYLVIKITGSRYYGFISGLLYAFSPFMFSLIISGASPGWVAYAFSPLYFYFLSSYLFRGGRKLLFGIVIIHFFVIVFLQYFVLTTILSIVYGIYIYRRDSEGYETLLKRLLILTVVFFIINSYWILPLLYQLTDFYSNIIQHSSVAGGFPAVTNSKQSILHILFGTGFLDRNLYFESLSRVELSLYVISVSAILILIFTSHIKRNVSRVGLFFLLIFLLIMLLVKGGNAPFGNITMIFYEYFPLMKMYRSPQNLFYAIAFLFPIIVSTSMHKVKKIRLLMLILSMSSMVGWFNAGDIGRQSLSEQGKDHLDFYTISNDIKKVYENNSNRELLHKELFIPSAYSVFFEKNEVQNEAQGQIPEYFYLDKQPMFLENVDYELMIDFQESIDRQFLKQNSIRYITIRNDVRLHHSIMPKNYFNAVKKTLDLNFKKVYDSKTASTYLVEDFIPAFYICQNHISYQSKVLQNSDYGACKSAGFKFANILENLSSENDRARPLVEYSKVSPVEYRVNIKGVHQEDRFLLRFFQRYDRLWRLIPIKTKQSVKLKVDNDLKNDYLNSLDSLDVDNYKHLDLTNPSGGKFVSKNFYNSIQNDNIIGQIHSSNGKPLDDKFHISVDHNSVGLDKFVSLNGWVISINYLEQNFKNYIVSNDDGTYNVEFKVFYFPQKIFTMASTISLVGFLIIVGVFAYKSFMRRRIIPINSQF